MQTTECSLGIWKVSQMVSEHHMPMPQWFLQFGLARAVKWKHNTFTSEDRITAGGAGVAELILTQRKAFE